MYVTAPADRFGIAELLGNRFNGLDDVAFALRFRVNGCELL